MTKKYAVILSGCGHFDGAEIRESVLTLLSLDTNEVEYEVFAPNQNQHHTLNHITGDELSNNRNVLEESARIARGDIKDLSNLNTSDFAGLLIPGGFGVAKNFCTFAFKGSQAEVNPLIRTIVKDFYNAKKPIGAICIAPALLALVLGEYGIEVTIGNDEGTAKEVEKTGAKHISCGKSEFHLDTKNKIATTPAYMYDDNKLHLVQKGINAIVNTIIEWS